NAGNLLHLFQGTLTNFSGNTLTGGTYNVYGTVANPGTLQIDALGNTGGEIVNHAATILLDGPNSNFVDQAGLDALSNFSNNTATGSFTIENGRNFTSPGDFANAGAVNIGATSTFTSTGDYNQSGGSTQVNGTLTAGSGNANFNGGVLFGNGGIVNGNVMMAGTIAPAGTINGFNMPLTAGALTINGNYTQTSAGIFNLGLGGLSPGTQFGFLNITGNALLDGTLNVSLIGGFHPMLGNSFTFLMTGGSVTNEFANVNGLNIGGGEILEVIYGSNFVELTTAASPTTDTWNGGTGNWSNGGQWSIGVPTPPDDVIIYSGGSDTVTMDFGSTTINSLTLGGPTNGFTSELTDGGNAENLTITTFLTVGQNGLLSLTGGSTVTAGADSSNAGTIDLENASNLTIHGNFTNSGTLTTGSVVGGNSFTVDGNFNNSGSFSLNGNLDLGNVGSINNTGSVYIGYGTQLNLSNQPGGVTDVPGGSSWQIYGSFTENSVNFGFENLSSIE